MKGEQKPCSVGRMLTPRDKRKPNKPPDGKIGNQCQQKTERGRRKVYTRPQGQPLMRLGVLAPGYAETISMDGIQDTDLLGPRVENVHVWPEEQ